MSIFTLDKYWKPAVDGNNNKILTMNPSGLGELIRAETGVSRELYDLKQSIAMLASPAKAVSDYEAELVTLSESLVPMMQKDIADLTAAGYPTDVAEKYALASAERVFQERKSFTLLKNPLMNNPEVLVSKEAGVAVAHR
eukprot:TRINITY_DN4602_c0_g1_i6.p1 TRINITY_DN4602_c0_g1~~TRINITY_DN4602_c0_g1_i6.p1  ORF type:complete len:140 (+),score=26.81 TRINITY_DN4602_c0_g1_i6:37-456(+)